MHRLLFGALAALAASGCMLAPFDGQTVTSTTNPISFQGMHLAPGGNVTLEAFDFSAGIYRPIGSATAAAEGEGYTFSDGTVYGWSTPRTLGPAFWGPGSRYLGSHALVRAVTTGTDGLPLFMMSVNEDWARCWNANGQSIGAFGRECRSAHSPVAELRTADYCDPAIDTTQYTGWLFYDAASRRIGARLEIISTPPILSPRITFSLTRDGAPVSATWSSCTSVPGSPGNRLTYTCYTSSFSVPTACAYNALATGPHGLMLQTRTLMNHPCHARTDPQNWSARSATCTTPPPPETRPNLTVSIGAHDGVSMPVSVCNVGPGTYSPVGSGLVVSTQGSLQPLAAFTDVSSLVPTLAAGMCASVGTAFIGAPSGAGGGGYSASTSGSACVDTSNVIDEVSNADNCASRLKD